MSSIVPNFNSGFGAANFQGDRYDVASSPGTPFSLLMQTNYTRITVQNKTAYGASLGTPESITAWWTAIDPMGSAYIYEGTAASPIMQSAHVATNGIYMRATGFPTLGPVIVGGTTITAATPAVATVPSTAGLVSGMAVQLYGITGMSQLNQYIFTISNVTPTTFTLPNLPAGTFAGGATAFKVQPIAIFPVTPTANYITAASSVGSSTVLELAVTHNYWVGMTLTLSIPPQFGAPWSLASAATAVYTVTALGATLNGSTNTVTINLNSSTFGAFAFPTSAVAASTNVSPAQVIPIGQQPPAYLPISSTATYQNTVLMNTAPFLTLGSSVCGNVGDVLTIWGSTENFITQGTVTTYPPIF